MMVLPLFHMWHLFCPYLFLGTPSVGASAGLCFVIVAFPWYLDLSYIFIQLNKNDHLFSIHYAGNSLLICITKTRLYNFVPLKPHFYIVKLGFIGVYIIFLISV